MNWRASDRLPSAWRGAYGLGRVLGIPFRVHVSALLVPVVVVPIVCSGDRHCALGLLVLLASLVSLLLHELGHAVVARRLGIEVVDLTVYPVGGVLRVATKLPSAAEWKVALAGPLVNAVLAACAFAGLSLMGQRGALVGRGQEDMAVQLLAAVVWLNGMLFLFNLAPAYPMDGGRVLKSRLVGFLGERAGLRVASSIGQGLGLLAIVIAAVLASPWLGLLAITLIIAARREEREERAFEERREPRESPDPTGSLPSVAMEDTLLDAARLLAATGAECLLVRSEPAGPQRVLHHRDVFFAMRQHGPDERVGDLCLQRDQSAPPA